MVLTLLLYKTMKNERIGENMTILLSYLNYQLLGVEKNLFWYEQAFFWRRVEGIYFVISTVLLGHRFLSLLLM
jgi:hypothetical protein